MKIKVKQDLCCGVGLCVKTAPDVYKRDKLGYNSSDGHDGTSRKRSVGEGRRRCVPRKRH